MKLSFQPRFRHPCVRYFKSPVANRQTYNNNIIETFSHRTYRTVLVANRSRIPLASRFSTWGISRQYEDEEEEEEHGPVWKVIEKTGEDATNEKSTNTDPDQQKTRKQDISAPIENTIEEEDANVLETSQTIMSPTEPLKFNSESEQQKLQAQVKWNQQINHLIQMSKFPEALNMIETALQSNFPLNLINFNTIAKCYSRLNVKDKLHKVIEEMKQRGVRPDAITFNIIIDNCGKRKDLKAMSHYFAKMLVCLHLCRKIIICRKKVSSPQYPHSLA